ncbi:MAG: hypothetical protein MPW15_22995 [Candidatus Manganitrophus sp.]|nr:hypothetical protein [Candidatus Manganitrophus sp.]
MRCDAIAQGIQTAKAGLGTTRGSRSASSCSSAPRGVGKTETALALAETLYGGEQNMVT